MRHRLLAEAFGTFGIVIAPVLLSEGGLTAGAWVSGLVVLAMIYTFGPVSAAHFNPAVTFGFALTRRFPWSRVPGYWGAQIAGATLAAGLGAILAGRGAGEHVPTADFGRSVAYEAIAAFLLMVTIMAAATDRRAHPATSGLAIGMAVVVGVWVAGPISGGSMNPARSLGPALFAGGDALHRLPIYLLGPMLGTTLGALAYESVRSDAAFGKEAGE